MKCVNHSDKDAVAMCVSCGVGLCSDCRKVVRGASFCPDCAETHQPMRVDPRAGSGLNVWAVIAWILAVVGWWPGLEFVSIAGLVLGFVALGDMSLRGGQSGRAYAYAAIACAGIGLLVKLAIVVYMLKTGIELSPWVNPFRYFGGENVAP
jgi:hypothetical protein